MVFVDGGANVDDKTDDDRGIDEAACSDSNLLSDKGMVAGNSERGIAT